jgi:hypothetical protein
MKPISIVVFVVVMAEAGPGAETTTARVLSLGD